MAGPIRIDVETNADRAARQMETLGSSTQRLGAKARSAFDKLKIPLAIAGAAAVKFGVDSVKAASDAQQSMGATQTVFGKYADDVVARSNKAAKAIGLSANEYRELANVTGASLSATGMPLRKVAGLTDDLNKRAADLAATFGGTTKDAVQAVGSLLRGEADPIEAYGVSIKQSDVNARLAAQGLDKLSGSALKQAEMQARLDLLFKQTTKSEGAFGRESGTLANQQQKLAAQFENIKAKVGTGLLPVLTKGATKLNAFLTQMQNGEGAGGKFAAALGKVRDNAGTIAITLGAIVAAYTAYKVVLLAVAVAQAVQTTAEIAANAAKAVSTSTIGTWLGVKALEVGAWVRSTAATVAGTAATLASAAATRVASGATKAFAAAQWLVNVALRANPIILIVSLLVALGVALVMAYKKSETFRRIVDKAWNGIKAVTSAVFGFVKSFVSSTWNAIKSVVSSVVGGVKSAVSGAWNAIKSATSSVWDTVKSLVSSAWNGIKTAVTSGISGVISLVSGLPGKITGALGNLGSLLLDAGRSIIQGLLDGIQSMIGSVQSKLSELTNLIPDWKGPRQKDKRLLRPAGRMIIQGLIKGFNDGSRGVEKVLGRLTKKIKKALDQKYDGRTLQKATRQWERWLKRADNALRRNAKAQDKNTAKIKDARKALADLIKERRDYAKAIRESTVEYGSIASIEEGHMNAPSALVEQMKARVEAARQWADMLKRLKSMGLNKTTLQQLIDAGISGGSAQAQALLAGGSSVISQVNAMTTELASIGQGLGNDMATHFYSAGQRAAQGLVNGLVKKGKALDKAAKRLASALARAVRKSLGIKSPSRVFREIGDNVVKGLSIGLDETYVKRQASALAGSLEKGFGNPALKAYEDRNRRDAAGTVEKVSVTLTAAQVSQLQRGREIALDLKAYEKAGGRR